MDNRDQGKPPPNKGAHSASIHGVILEAHEPGQGFLEDNKPEKFLKPDPEMSKKGENRYVDANPIINMVVENPKLKEGETKRMHLMLGETPDKDRLV